MKPFRIGNFSHYSKHTRTFIENREFIHEIRIDLERKKTFKPTKVVNEILNTIHFEISQFWIPLKRRTRIRFFFV